MAEPAAEPIEPCSASGAALPTVLAAGVARIVNSERNASLSDYRSPLKGMEEVDTFVLDLMGASSPRRCSPRRQTCDEAAKAIDVDGIDDDVQLRLLLANAEAEAEEQADRASVAERRVAALEAELSALRNGDGRSNATQGSVESFTLSPPSGAGGATGAASGASWSGGAARGRAVVVAAGGTDSEGSGADTEEEEEELPHERAFRSSFTSSINGTPGNNISLGTGAVTSAAVAADTSGAAATPASVPVPYPTDATPAASTLASENGGSSENRKGSFTELAHASSASATEALTAELAGTKLQLAESLAQHDEHRREYRLLENKFAKVKLDLAKAQASQDDVVAEQEELIRRNQLLQEELLQLKSAQSGWFTRKSK